jgi:hypothetical protein
MHFAELIDTVRESSRDDWNKITCWGGMGPSYHDRLHFWTAYGDGAPVHSVGGDSHSTVAVFREDIDLTMAWGMDRDWEPDGDSPNLSFSWQKNMPDPSVSVIFGDIFYRGSLVHREFMVVVDGGRGTMPLGRTRTKAGREPMSGNPDDFEEVVTTWEVAFARLVNSFGSRAQEFDRYLDAMGYVIEPQDYPTAD